MICEKSEPKRPENKAIEKYGSGPLILTLHSVNNRRFEHRNEPHYLLTRRMCWQPTQSLLRCHCCLISNRTRKNRLFSGQEEKPQDVDIKVVRLQNVWTSQWQREGCALVAQRSITLLACVSLLSALVQTEPRGGVYTWWGKQWGPHQLSTDHFPKNVFSEI